MNSSEIRQKFLNFFEEREHHLLGSAPLVIRDNESVTGVTLFNTAGMQPLVPFFMGKDHPKGNRLASSQKCLRTIDIDEVGDNTHLTFFEMLGNWSIGDYFKEDAIAWSYEFLTSKKTGLGLDPNKIYVTVFSGNETTGKDEESYKIWQKYIPKDRICFLEDNWWEAGESGPGGIDTEIFYNVTDEDLGDLSDPDNFKKADKDQKVVEVWNNVFMEYEKKDGKIVGKLPRNIVDTGAGLERLTIVVNGVDNIYETDSFKDLIATIEEESEKFDMKSARIIADHIKASTFIISEGVTPSNTEHGYVLRRLLRKAIMLADKIGFENITKISNLVCELYEDTYEELEEKESIVKVIKEEQDRFRKTIRKGMKEFEKKKSSKISGEDAFLLFSTYGFPIELTLDIAKEKNIEVDLKGFEDEMKKHKEKSRTAAEGKFKGGLQDRGEIETKYHTTTHLLHQALRDVLGDHVQQKGSNINSDRLRFDFAHHQKMTDEEKRRVEEIVNQKIQEKLPVVNVEMSYEDALKTGALHFFADKYGDTISIYYIGDSIETAYSKEFCGGPHVENTEVLGKFKIKKEEASSAGVRRIKAVLE